jgi:acetyl-CoA acetyltransferase
MAGAHFGIMAIQLGNEDIVISGGFESCSHFPIPLWTHDTNMEQMMEDAIASGAAARGNPNPKLWEVVEPATMIAMGNTAENLAAKFDISREVQDHWAWQSNMRAAAAQKEGKFKHEIIPMEGQFPDGTVATVDYDEGVRPDSSLEKIRSLPPIYKPDGTVTAASSSKQADAAGAGIFTLAAQQAVPRAGLKPDQIDLWESNAAFAVVPLTQIKIMGLDPDKMNVNGDACCIGHPIGASGIRMIGTLAHEMNRRGSRYGCGAICGGFGQGTAMVVEREEYWDGHRAWLS